MIWKEKSAGRREKSLGIDSNESPLDHHAAAYHGNDNDDDGVDDDCGDHEGNYDEDDDGDDDDLLPTLLQRLHAQCELAHRPHGRCFTTTLMKAMMMIITMNVMTMMMMMTVAPMQCIAMVAALL